MTEVRAAGGELLGYVAVSIPKGCTTLHFDVGLDRLALPVCFFNAGDGQSDYRCLNAGNVRLETLQRIRSWRPVPATMPRAAPGSPSGETRMTATEVLQRRAGPPPKS